MALTTAVTPFREPDRTAAPALGTERAPLRMPADVFRTSDHYLVQIDLPGIAPESLEVTADDRALAVSAERALPVDGDQQHEVLVAERRHGRFFRQVSLPEEADLDRITADYRDGVLTVLVPVAMGAGARRIAVTHPNGPEQASAEKDMADQDVAAALA